MHACTSCSLCPPPLYHCCRCHIIMHVTIEYGVSSFHILLACWNPCRNLRRLAVSRPWVQENMYLGWCGIDVFVLLTCAVPELSLASQEAFGSVCGRQKTHGTQSLLLALVCLKQHSKMTQMQQRIAQLEMGAAVPQQQPADIQNAEDGSGASNAVLGANSLFIRRAVSTVPTIQSFVHCD